MSIMHFLQCILSVMQQNKAILMQQCLVDQHEVQNVFYFMYFVNICEVWGEETCNNAFGLIPKSEREVKI